MDPNPLLRGYALNNLAVACWWHKHPSFRDLEDNDEDGSASTTSSNSSSGNKEYSAQQIDADFDNAISMFKKSIMYIENVDELQDMQRRNNLRLLLDQEKIIPTEYQKFVSQPTTQEQTHSSSMIDTCVHLLYSPAGEQPDDYHEHGLGHPNDQHPGVHIPY